MTDKLVRALTRVVFVLLVALGLIVVSPAWVIVLARFDGHPVPAGFAVLGNLAAIAFFGVNTFLLALLTAEAFRTRTAEEARGWASRVSTVLGAMTIVMATCTIVAVIVVFTLLTSSTASLAPWSAN